MPDLAKITAIETKLNAEAEPAPETNAAPPPDGGSSGADSAPADGGASAGGSPPGAGEPSPGAPIDHDKLREKLERDRERREERARRKKLEEDSAAAAKAREEAEAAKAKYANLGKGKPFLETIKELGLDPRQTFEQMREEALKAGTPEAKLEAMERAWQTRLEGIEQALSDERKAREDERKAIAEERKQSQARAAHEAFVTDFRQTIADPRFESLTEEYEPAQLFPLVQSFKANPPSLFEQAKTVGVQLTRDDGRFTMVDILSVLKATQDRHFARLEEQRRKKSAAPQTSQAAPQQAPTSKPTVNGTAERNAGNSLGNQLAATRAADPSARKESKEERLRRLGAKYG